jgi:ribosomal protein S18 acetylase RimI-like enzyme
MQEETPHIDVRSLQSTDAPALYAIGYSFETDRIYTLRVRNKLLDEQNESSEKLAFAFELLETSVDPPLYKNYREHESTVAAVEAKLRKCEGGYVAFAADEMAGAILLNVEEWHSVARVEDLIVGHQFRRYGIGTLLLNCASDWARKRDCWAVVLETQNVNYPAIQFYLRNGFEIWSINQHFYPPGSAEHEVAIHMGKRLNPSQSS